MFKKNICAIAVLFLLTGCVQKDSSTNNYDLANHWFSLKNLNDNKIVLNKNFTEQYNDGSKTSAYTDYTLYKKSNTDSKQVEQYTFFEDINKQNYKTMLSNKSVDLKYNILLNEIKESFYVEEQAISSYKRNIKIKDKAIEDSDIDGNVLVCTFSNYYETMSIKDKVNEFFKSKYSIKDKNYHNVMELKCEDSYVDGEYRLYFAKDIGTVLFVRKNMEDGSLEESFSILDTQTIIE